MAQQLREALARKQGAPKIESSEASALEVPQAVQYELRILRRREVEQTVGLSRSALYRRISAGSFPRPIPISGGRAVGWLASEVQEFCARCVAQRDERAAI
jgi:prophage regulatory protein